ncbi:hypothetical protein BG011_002534 [Mortierella polycephala]|uniref:Uncharacterized protein n=1 Tax=Mortierella polycephala TaxID=41804 RepID=A0A9P6U4S9_9FUNG|nr:hypothetical protein BG011_002534 [Mortierella polycephala]
MTMDRVDKSGQEFESESGTVHSLQAKRHNNEGMEDADPELADRLLAALLVLYKDAMINLWAPSYPPPFFHGLQTYTAMTSSLKLRSISEGSSLQEQEAAKVAMQASDCISGMTFAECLFYAIVSLQRPSFSFKQSLDRNAKAVFNVVIASIVEGSQTHDCERLLLHCIHLKDADECYPLRSLASTVCLEMITEESLPNYARTSILKFILGPADFILHHLETRISLTGKITSLLAKNSYGDLVFRSLIQRIAKRIGLRKPTSAFEQLKFRLYQYLDLVVTDPVRYCKQNTITEVSLWDYMPVAQWKVALDQDLILYFYQNEFQSQMLLFLEIIRIIGITFSFYEPTSVQKVILGSNQELDTTLTMRLMIVQRRIYTCFETIKNSLDELYSTDNYGVQQVMDRAFDIVLNLKPLQHGSIWMKLALSQNYAAPSFISSLSTWYHSWSAYP